LVLLQAADGLITWCGLTRGAIEQNPVLSPFLGGSLGVILSIKAVGVALMLWLIYRPCVKTHPHTNTVLTGIVFAYLAVVSNNLIVLKHCIS
jgi:hypothetical protein